MFIAVRKYRVRRSTTAEWAQRVRDDFVPLMRDVTFALNDFERDIDSYNRKLDEALHA